MTRLRVTNLRTHARDERGAFIILFPILLLVMLGVAALLIDLGQLKATRRANQQVADLAVLSGSRSLGSANPVQACQDAVGYFNINAPRLGGTSINKSTFCAQSGNEVGLTTCSGGTLAQAAPTTTIGSYQVTLHYPVPDSEITDTKFTGVGLNDGARCDRMGIIIMRTDPTTFGRVLGATSLRTTRRAVVRASGGLPQKQAPSLWLLDPTGCTSLSSQGNNTIVTVGSAGASPVPGLITIDSDGSGCASNQDTISSGGSGSLIQAVPTTGTEIGVISLVALPAAATICVDPACKTADVAGGRIKPQPVPSKDRATRAPVDWRYRCKKGYPQFHGIAIVDCPSTTTTPNYIDGLVGAIGTSGSPGISYQRWTAAYSCNVPSGVTTVTGNWWVDCPNFVVNNNANVNFLGGNIVFDGDFSMTGGSMIVNGVSNPMLTLPAACKPPLVTVPCTGQASQGAAFVYMRSGSFSASGGSVTLNAVSLIQKNGYFTVTGGATPVWSAPTEGPFLGLSVWSDPDPKANFLGKYAINGGANMNLGGLFFVPEAAPFGLSGGAPLTQQHAQFIAFQMQIGGGSNLNVVPDASATKLPPRSGMLIR